MGAKRTLFSGVILSVLLAAILLSGIGFSACPSGYYPDPTDANCKAGKPYSVQVNTKNIGDGKIEIKVDILNIAGSSTIGVSSRTNYVVPFFSYSDGSKVQLGDYSLEPASSSVKLGSCNSYPLAPGESATFTTVAYFKPSQEGREIVVSADNINWLVLPEYPKCTISAQGSETKVGEKRFTFSYSFGAPRACSAEGASCDGSVCCAGLYCAQSKLCETIPGEQPRQGSSATTASGQSKTSGDSNSGSGISNALVLGILLGIVVLGAAAYFLFFRGKSGDGAEINHAHSAHKKRR